MAEGVDRRNKPRRSRSKRFFTSCFGSSDMDGEDGCRLEKDDDGSSRVSQSLKVEKEEGIDGHKKRKKGYKRLARVLKAIFFETFLVQKVRKKKHTRDSLKQDSISTGSSTKQDSTSKLTKDINYSPKSLSSSSIQTPSQFSYSRYSLSKCSSLSPSPSIKSNSRRYSRVDSKALKRCYSRVDSPLFFLLVAILIFIVLGKIYAIFCTSTCLYFVPRWGSNSVPPNGRFASY